VTAQSVCYVTNSSVFSMFIRAAFDERFFIFFIRSFNSVALTTHNNVLYRIYDLSVVCKTFELGISVIRECVRLILFSVMFKLFILFSQFDVCDRIIKLH